MQYNVFCHMYVTVVSKHLDKFNGNLKFQILMAVSIQMAGFWVVTICSLVEVYRCFRSVGYLHHEGVHCILFWSKKVSDFSGPPQATLSSSIANYKKVKPRFLNWLLLFTSL
jgi:hypothetical protein